MSEEAKIELKNERVKMNYLTDRMGNILTDKQDSKLVKNRRTDLTCN